MNDKFWGDLNTQLMVTAAHRYCLGRQSYIVGSAIEWLWEHRQHFERKTIMVIVRDTIEAIHNERAGSPLIDVPGWRKLARDLYKEMSEEEKACLRYSVSHLGDFILE